MFSVYGKSGLMFRGSMEELRKIGPTSALARTRRVAAVGREAAEGFMAQLALVGNEGHGRPMASAATHDLAHNEAMAAYARTANSQPPRHPLMRVRDIMNPGAICVAQVDSLGQAWDLLAEHQLGQAPVVDGAGVLVGLLTRAELMRSDRLPGRNSHALVWQAFLAQGVAELMWTPVPSVAPDTDIRRLARVLLDTGLPGLPVVDDVGKVQAFVSRTDILRAVVADPPLDLWT